MKSLYRYLSIFVFFVVFIIPVNLSEASYVFGATDISYSDDPIDLPDSMSCNPQSILTGIQDIGDRTIENSDVFIAPDSTIVCNNLTVINGDIYIFGRLLNLGHIECSGKIFTANYEKYSEYYGPNGYLIEAPTATCSDVVINSSFLGHGFPVLNHDYPDTWDTVIESTCQREGKISRTCHKCQYVEYKVTPIGDCSFTQWIITTKPSCTTFGVQTRKCVYCGKLETKNLPKADHTLWRDYSASSPATCTTVGSEVWVCAGCDYKQIVSIPATGHFFNSWIVTVSPTYTSVGTEERRCSLCGKTELQTIPRLETSITDSNGNTSIPTPPGKDDSNSASQSPVTKPTVKPVLKLNITGTLPLQLKKSFSGVKATKILSDDKIVRWKSSNSKIVSISKKGKLTAKKTGKATITAYTKKGATASFRVTVQKKVSLKKLSVNKRSVTLKLAKNKKSFQLNVTKMPLSYTGKITYRSANKKIAAITSKGKITAKKVGKTKIYVKCGNKTITIRVTVKKK